MKCDFIVLKNRFAILLIEFDCCTNDNNCDENEKIKKSYFIVERDRRDDVSNFFDREITSVHDIDFFDVVNIVTYEIIDVNKTDKINEVNKIKDETNDVANAIVTEIVVNFFACFVRTCSCNLMLLKDLTEQRLHENVSIFFFVIRVFSICCILNWFHVSWKFNEINNEAKSSLMSLRSNENFWRWNMTYAFKRDFDIDNENDEDKYAENV